jgi:hypothetical protein
MGRVRPPLQGEAPPQTVLVSRGHQREPRGHVNEGWHASNRSGSGQPVLRWRMPAGSPNAEQLCGGQRTAPKRVPRPVPYSRVQSRGSLENISPGTVYLTLVLQETVLVLQQGCLVLDRTSSPGLPPPSKHHERSERSHQKRQ